MWGGPWGGPGPPHNGITDPSPPPALLQQMSLAAARLSPGRVTTGALVPCNMGPALPPATEGSCLRTADKGRTSRDPGKSLWVLERANKRCLHILSKEKTLCPRLSKVWKEWRGEFPHPQKLLHFSSLRSPGNPIPAAPPGRFNPFSPGLKRLLGRKPWLHPMLGRKPAVSSLSHLDTPQRHSPLSFNQD